ncbi:DUF551 domain-containing protein [Scandinavium sp. M-37]|uniref:DUF551 domain-containing protein n=1 Tax=Scandinavium sp. M-37 TaxID=3373077 RepID=UPI003745AEAC
MTNNKLTGARINDETLSAWKSEAVISLGETPEDIPEYSHHQAILALVTEVQEYRKAAGEPVAWMVIDSDSGEKFISTDRSNIEGAAMPLYTTPQPAPTVEVRPIAFFDGDISPDDAEKLAAAIRELNNAPSEPAILAAVEAVPDERVEFNAWNNDADCPLAGLTVKQAAWLAWLKRSGVIKSFEPVADELPGWIKCSERMPEGMQTVITSNGLDIGQGWWDGDTWQGWSNHDAVPGGVTHWMLLPAAPQQ